MVAAALQYATALILPQLLITPLHSARKEMAHTKVTSLNKNVAAAYSRPLYFSVRQLWHSDDLVSTLWSYKQEHERCRSQNPFS